MTEPSPRPTDQPEPAPPTVPPPSFSLDPKVAKAFLRFAGGFWTGATEPGQTLGGAETARRAWIWTIALAASLIASTYITVQMNHWNRWFFDALERKDIATVKQAVLVFLGIIAVMAAIGVAIVIARETLQVRWRQWLVEHLLDRWLSDNRFYFLNATGKEPPNPEYRISDDSRWATEVLVDLGIGLLSAVIGGLAFVSILWTVGGALTVGGVTVPGYMVWAALAYGVCASLIMAWIGRPLVGRVGSKNESEGTFRFAMMRLRDNAEAIALMDGQRDERRALSRAYDTVVDRWLQIVRSHGHVTWITNATGPMIPILPLLFAAPKYLAGELSLGQVTQLAAAFVQVQMAISWIVDNYNRIAEWYASARRVMDIVDASAAIDPHLVAAGSAVIRSQGGVGRPGGGELTVRDIGLSDRSGQTLIAAADLAVQPGELVHVYGNSSAGKSTLVRILAGLAKPTRGAVVTHDGPNLLVVPQKSYVPLGTLREVLLYPHAGRASNHAPDAMPIETALDAVGLRALSPRLDEPVRWDQSLSSGERQRLGIARAILHAPEIVVLDDAVSALEEPVQIGLHRALRAALPEAMILSFAQRPLPPSLATRQLIIETSPSGAHLRPAPSAPEPVRA